MNLSKVFLGFTGCLLAAASLNGCIVVADNSPSDPGTIDVNITIDGANDFLVCSDFLVDEIEVVVLGHDDISARTDCNDLGITLEDVPEGSYQVQVTLLADGRQVSDPGIVNVHVGSGEVVSIDVDFPADSIDPP